MLLTDTRQDAKRVTNRRHILITTGLFLPLHLGLHCHQLLLLLLLLLLGLTLHEAADAADHTTGNSANSGPRGAKRPTNSSTLRCTAGSPARRRRNSVIHVTPLPRH